MRSFAQRQNQPQKPVSSKAGAIQTKLAINKPGDEYEREADRIADQVVAAPAHPAASGAAPHIQRYAGQSTEQADTAPASVDRVLASPGRPLDPALQQDMEQRFDHDFSRVRVHSGPAAEQSAREINARAYTAGHNVVFAAGQFAPGTQEGRRLIAHEFTHVVQQSKAGEAVQRAPGPDEKVKKETCAAPNTPATIGTVKAAVMEAAGHATGAGALVPELKSVLELYIRVVNAGYAEQMSFGEQEKKLRDEIAKKEDLRNQLLSIAAEAGKLGFAVAANYATAAKAIAWVATGADAANDLTGMVPTLMGEDAENIKLLLNVNQTFSAFATSVRADLGAAIGNMENIVDKLITGELYQAGVKSHFVVGEITRAQTCGMSYDAKTMSSLVPIVQANAKALEKLAGDLAELRAMATAAKDPDGVKWLKEGTDTRTGYKRLVEMVKAGENGLRLVYWSDKDEYVLLMTEAVENELRPYGFISHFEHFSRFDHGIKNHKTFTINYLKNDGGKPAAKDGQPAQLPLALVLPLREIGLRSQEQKGRPNLNWKDLPDIQLDLK